MEYPTKILCFGDSITQGNEENGFWNELVNNKLNEWKPNIFTCLNKGHNGNTTALGLDRFETDIISELPATVIIEFGVNDCNHRAWAGVPRVSLSEFRRNLREFHRLIKKHGGECIFIANHLVEPLEGSRFLKQGNGKTYTENLLPYNQAIRDLSYELSVPLIDVENYIRKNSINPQILLVEDGVHLSKKGYDIYSGFIFEKLKDIL